jgi:hypothetical protein
MKDSLPPSTDWKEQIAPDEAQRFEDYGQQFAELQRRKNKKYGAGRALHRKQITAAKGQLNVLGDLPEFARHGLFAKRAQFDVWVRLSNGSPEHASDRIPDIRGFAFKVFGVQGDSALGNGRAVSQDFALINQEQFAFPKSDEFIDFVMAAAKGGAALLKHMLLRYGVLRGSWRMAKMFKTVAKPFTGFADTAMFSAAPIACGPYAVRVRLVPAPSNKIPLTGIQTDWNADFSGRLARQSLQWELQLQPFVNEKITPIEDASVNWPTPYTTVARLTLPMQDTSTREAIAFAERAEAGVFDPWQALAAHRPLGDVMRARKVVYFTSQQGRGAA